jgi:hypothetical protein
VRGFQIHFGKLKWFDEFQRRSNAIKSPAADTDGASVFDHLADGIFDAPLERYPFTDFELRFSFISRGHFSHLTKAICQLAWQHAARPRFPSPGRAGGKNFANAAPGSKAGLLFHLAWEK